MGWPWNPHRICRYHFISGMLFDVRITAFDPQAAVDPVEALMRLFKIERAFAREVVHRLPRVIKRGVPLETAQRLTQVLERIGAKVEVLVSERTQVGTPAPKPAEQAPDSGSRPSTPRVTLGREALLAAVRGEGTPATGAPALVGGSSQLARRSQPSVTQRAEALAAQPQPAPRVEPHPSQPQPVARSETRETPFDAEVPTASVRALMQSAPDDAAMLGRVSLPMGSWAEPAASEVSRVSGVPSSPQLPQVAPANDAQRPAQLGLPPPKPSVKELLLARRNQMSQPSESSSRGGRGSLHPAASGRLTLPVFHARGPSLADDIEELPGSEEQRRSRWIVSWLLWLLASLVTLGLFGVASAFYLVARQRRRVAALRELQSSALLVGQGQLPDLYHCVKQLAIRLELSPSPRLYVAERCPGKVQSFVQRGGLVIVLDAGLLGAAARVNAGYVVQFALAHEIAAFALGQHAFWRRALASLWASVRRGDLLSADALASKLMNDRNEPVRALAAWLCGPELAHLVDLGELERQATSQEQEARVHGDSSEDVLFLLLRIQQLRKLIINGK